MTASLQNTVVLAPWGFEIPGKHNRPGTVRPQTPAKCNSSGTMRTTPQSWKTQQFWTPNPLKIQQFWFHTRAESLENTADRNRWKNIAGLVPHRNPWKIHQFWFHSRPKSLETHIVERDQNPWNTTQSLGLSLHLSTRLVHWMWAQGWHLASWLNGEFF